MNEKGERWNSVKKFWGGKAGGVKGEREEYTDLEWKRK